MLIGYGVWEEGERKGEGRIRQWCRGKCYWLASDPQNEDEVQWGWRFVQFWMYWAFIAWVLTKWKDLVACWISKPEAWLSNQVEKECGVRSQDVDLGFRATWGHRTKGEMTRKSSTEDQGRDPKELRDFRSWRRSGRRHQERDLCSRLEERGAMCSGSFWGWWAQARLQSEA